MGKTRYLMGLLILIIIGFGPGCSSRSEKMPPELVCAESVMYERPDSALAILQSMPVPPASQGLQHATWCLLMTQARDKNNIHQTSDSLINIAYHYFMKHGDAQRKAMALHYEGQIHEDMGKAETAIQFYLRASDEVKKTKDYRLGFLANSSLGMVYAYRSMADLAMKAMKEAYRYALLANDSSYIASSWCYFGRIYSIKSDWENSIKSYQKAIAISELTRDNEMLCRGLDELSAIYLRVHNYESAFFCLYKLKTIDSSEKKDNLSRIYLEIGDTYRHIAQYDSAKVYLNKALIQKNINIYTKRSIYQCLYLISKEQKDYDHITEYVDAYITCRDSVDRLNQTKSIGDIQARYNQKKLEKKNVQLDFEHSRLLRNSLIVLALILLASGVIIYIYQRRLLKNERIIRTGREQMRQYVLRLQDNEDTIRMNENRIRELSEEQHSQADLILTFSDQTKEIEKLSENNKALQKENEQLQSEIIRYNNENGTGIKSHEKLIRDNKACAEREKILLMMAMDSNASFHNLNSTLEQISDDQWHTIENDLNRLYNAFVTRIIERLPNLKPIDLKLICMMKLQLTDSFISHFLGINVSSVVKQKRRLRERIGLDLGEPFSDKHSFENWIDTFEG